MSVYALDAEKVLERAAHHGLYDLGNQIVVIPSEGVPPDVVVDHEITHINLVLNTSLGRLEQGITFLRRAAAVMGEPVARQRLDQWYGRPLQQACELTHEAVAWFGTEMHAGGRDVLTTPARYRPLVQRLQRLFAPTDIPPMRRSEDDPAGQIDIVENAAQLALNSPVVERILGDPDAAVAAPFGPLLARRREEQPLWRFQAVLDWLERCPAEQLVAWADGRDGRDGRGGGDGVDAVDGPTIRSSAFGRRRPLPEVRLRDLFRADVDRFVQSVAEASGLGDRTPSDDNPATWAELWSDGHLVDTFVPQLDRYAQTCVVGPFRSSIPVTVSADPPPAAEQADIVIAGVVPPGDYRQGWHTPFPEGGGHLIFGGRRFESTAWVSPGEQLRPVLLQARDRRAAIAASSNNYAYASADYLSCPLLADIPHTVMALLDFRALWTHLGFGEGGLAGTKAFEWAALPSPRFGKPYGYLLVKPTDRPYPVVVLPIAGPPHRVVSAATDLPSPLGHTLDPARASLPSWLGPLAHHVTLTIASFEHWSTFA